MGIKGDPQKASEGDKIKERSSQLLNNLESQYETSRYMTHLAKGAGLGFGLHAQISQNKVNPNDTDDLHQTSH